MKRLITLLMSCCLALAATAVAQEHEQQASPAQQQPEQSHGRKQARQQANDQTGQTGRKERAGRNGGAEQNATGATTASTPNANTATRGRGKGRRNAAETNASGSDANATATDTNVNGNADTGKRARQGKGRRNAQKETTNPTNSPNPAAAGAGTGAAAAAGAAAQSPAPTAAATQTNTAAATNANVNANQQTNNRGAGRGKKVDPQRVQTIRSQHASFRAQPRPDRVPAVTFNQSHRIQGAEQWQGAQYGVFRSYHPERHDQGWYRSHYSRVELIGGGYYYWNNGYWFPAWGYSPSEQYYAYDGPIYVGHRAEPPDQVIADVQAVLQDAGYYRGEVDGLLGPLTREALTAYQADNGLYTTAAIDEPTLNSLDLG
jgi:putative peptidoglycan binding protein